MSTWNSGYFTDVGYTYGYYRELIPSMIAVSALSQRARLPGLDHRGIRMLELGAGQGVTANIIAAANADIHYTAVDFAPGQIAGARALADKAGLTNVEHIEASFEEVAKQGLRGEQYDLIVLHGIYTWVSDENRQFILQIIREQLKPGGAVYISYNCYPGWSAAVPFRRILLDNAALHPNLPLESRVDAGFEMMDRLEAVGARYLKSNPSLTDRIKRTRAMQRTYLAHEYLNRNWTLFFFADVAEELSTSKLEFVCSSNMLDHVDALNLTPDQQALINEIKDPIRVETTRDLIVNQQFRRDVFAKGRVDLSVGASRKLWLDQRFALMRVRSSIKLEVTGILGSAKLNEAVYNPIVDSLAEGPKTLAMMFQNPAIAKIGWNNVLEAIKILIGGGFIQHAQPVEAEEQSAEGTSKFNAAVCEMAFYSGELAYLASPVLGAGVVVDRVQQLFLHALNNKREPVAMAWEAFASVNQKLSVNGKVLETDDDNKAEITRRFTDFTNDILPVLRQLRVTHH